MLHMTLTLAAEGEKPSPLGHVLDKGVFGFVSMHMVTLTVAALLTLFVMLRFAKSYEKAEAGARLPKGRLNQLLETLCVGIREHVVRPQLGDATAKFIPYIWTLFFFILFNNMLGLIPIMDLQHLIGGIGWGDKHFAVVGGTATGNLAVTAGIATIAFCVIQINGIRQNGLGGWAHHFLGGAPVMLAPIMVPVEILSMIIKPAALAIRLCANMVAGHTLLATVLLFTGMGLGGLGLLFGSPVVVVSVGAAIAIYFLEIFVAFLQAFIFMFLTVIFIAQLMHHHHDDHEHAHDYDHDGVASAEDPAVPVVQ